MDRRAVRLAVGPDTRGTFSPNRAATPCNCRGADADRWRPAVRAEASPVLSGQTHNYPVRLSWDDADGGGAGVPAEGPMRRFRQIAQLPYAPVRRPMRAGRTPAGQPRPS